MQFHLNGFRPGDPRIFEAHTPGPRSEAVPEEADVLIVGCGPTGLTLAAQLAAFPEIKTAIIDQKPGRLMLGQADGVACRTMEMFEAFGFVDRVLKESYWVNEVTFWKPDDSNPGNIVRNGRIQDTEDGLSEFPHVILNQARIHDFYLDAMRNSPSRLEPYYSRRILDVTVADAGDRPVTVRLERTDEGHEGRIETLRARYVVGCDGARSGVRETLGYTLKGDSANQAWGVMDVLAVTDFPDIRLKATVLSADQGSVLVIPREGGYLVRIYVELEKLDHNERLANRKITLEQLIATAQRILHPYTLEVKEVAWWSAYEIGQRICDSYDDGKTERDPHVFIAGDACHTHSPKAGQGMNVSMQDAFNLGWKLISVLTGRSPASLLYTYSAERRAIAQDLIDFDREWATMFSAKPKAAGDMEGDGVDPAEFQKYFERKGRYTAGTETRYRPSILTAEPKHQKLAKGFIVGMRFHSAPAIRLADAKPVHLGHAVKADGRWRLFVFADRESPASAGSRVRALCDFLASAPDSPVKRHTPPSADVDSVIDVRALFQQGHRELRLEEMPAFLLPRKGCYDLCDYEKMFCADLRDGRDIFSIRGIDRDQGGIVVVRPDQYVAHVLPLDAEDELAVFFDRVLLRRS
ncbi:MAG: FAD-binding monooxygenase [Hyphomicrobiales bacterium]|nr:FAD-binding monooxygenase [Hyphomicrobiales bacterium]MBV8439864.1 FAD-binding monooxygenase [Hyphomicrobiales bacterium]